MTFKGKKSGGFTMIEIAFSLAIVAFALVAIMGVLPTGMTVQRDNREDTLINNDAVFWMEALRSGSRGIDDLTNYVEAITITNARVSMRWTNSFNAQTEIRSGEQIIGLLSTPKRALVGNEVVTNVVTARVRALNGPAIEKGNPTNEFSFRYELQTEVVPVLRTPPGAASVDPNFDRNVATNLHDLRVTLRWPVFEQGPTNWGVGRNRRSMRALMNGQLVASTVDTNYYFVMPNVYAYVPRAQP